MLHVAVAAAFKEIDESDEVGVDVGVGVFERVAHSRLGGEVDDDGEGPALEEGFDFRAIGDVDFVELEGSGSAEPFQPVLFIFGS